MEARLLQKEEIFGDNALDVIKQYGTTATPTDLVSLLGGAIAGSDFSCSYWSASSCFGEDVVVVDVIGKWCHVPPYRRGEIRPVLSASETSKLHPQKVRLDASGCLVCEWGEYPQTAADKDLSAQLEGLFQSNLLRLTGKEYTFDAGGLKDFEIGFQAKTCPEYEYNGKKYIRVLGNPLDGDSRLACGEKVEKGKAYWVCVEPIEWLMDEKTGNWVSKKCLTAGIQFDTKETYDDNLEKTAIANYIKNYLVYEILTTDRYLKVKALQKGSEERRALARKLFEIHREYDDINIRKLVLENNLMVKKLREKAGRNL